MNFKNKIILFIIIAVLLIVGLLASFLYSQEKYNIFNNFLEEDKLELKAECLKRVDKVNNKQFIEEINNLSYSDKGSLDIEKNIVNYLVCHAGEENKWIHHLMNPEIYYRTANLINKLNIPENNKKYILGEKVLGGIFYKLNENNNKIELTNNQHEFINYIALASMKEICPNGKISDYFLSACLKSADLLHNRVNEISEEILNKSKEVCNNLCESIIRYSNDLSNFEKDNENFSWLNDVSLLEVQFLIKSALAFRVGGKELALKSCDSIPNLDSKEKCKHYVISLDYINCKDFGFNEEKKCELREYENCEIFYNQAKNLTCEFYSK